MRVELELEKVKVAPMHKLIKKAGAERVSEDSALALGKALDDIGLKIAKEALDFAHHAGRKTVKAKDIEIAMEKILKR
jgi:histone H3/H4